MILSNKIETKRKTPLRLQYWKSRLTQYDFEAIHVAGENNIADYLSRCLKINIPKVNKEVDEAFRIFSIQTQTELKTANKTRNCLNKDGISIEQVAEATRKDKLLSEVIDCILNKRNPSKLITKSEFNGCFNEISLSDENVLFKDDKIIIPESLAETMVRIAHNGHLGAKLCKRMLPQSYYFSSMNKWVEEITGRCHSCQINTDKTRFNPIIASDIPKTNWERVAIDFSSKTPSGEYLLVIICERSRYPVVKLSKGLTSGQAINILKQYSKSLVYRFLSNQTTDQPS